jgi:hypothetical protein
MTEQYNPKICGMTGTITIDNMLTYIYNNTSDVQDVKDVHMTSKNNWILYNDPTIVNVSPTSGDSTTTQLQCIRTSWGNGTISLQNTTTYEIVTCRVEALYLETNISTIHFSNNGGTQNINVFIYGGETVDYGYSLSNNNFTNNNLTIDKNNNILTLTVNPNTTITNDITATLTLTHLSNYSLTKTINIIQDAAVISYANIWTNYACEKVSDSISGSTSGYTTSYSYNWKNYTCTKVLQNVTSYSYNWKNYTCVQVQQVLVDNNMSVIPGDDDVSVNLEYPVPSGTTLSISVQVTLESGVESGGSITIHEGEQTGSVPIDTKGSYISSAIITDVTPKSDNTYNYKF